MKLFFRSLTPAAAISWFICAFTVLHFLALPLVITFDGFLYLDQARMLFTPRFYAEWHFLRTPLLQALTRLAFEVVGEGPSVLVFINTALGLVGVGAVYGIARYILPPTPAALCALVAALNPLLVTYQHTYLTEAGSFALLSLIVLQLVRTVVSGFALRELALFGLAVTVGYYFRPTLFITSFPAVLLALMYGGSRGRIRVVATTLVCAVVIPFLLTLPWRTLGAGRNWEDAQVLFGVINQAVIPPDSERLGDARGRYVQALAASAREGHLTSSGIIDGEIYPLIDALEPQVRGRSQAWFMEIVREYPLRYVKGVVRGALLLSGVTGVDSDNDIFVDKVLHSDHNFIFAGPATLQSWVESSFSGHLQPGLFRQALEGLVPLYRWLYRLGVGALLCAFFVGVALRSPVLVALSIIPLTFLTYHAVTLFSLDRMIVPITPLACAAPFILLFAGGSFRRGSACSESKVVGIWQHSRSANHEKRALSA